MMTHKAKIAAKIAAPMLSLPLLLTLIACPGQGGKKQVQFVGHTNPEGGSDEYTAPPTNYDGTSGYGDGDSAANGTGKSNGEGNGDADGLKRNKNDFTAPDPGAPGYDPAAPGAGEAEPGSCTLTNKEIDFVNFPWPDNILGCYDNDKLFDFNTKDCAKSPKLSNFKIGEKDAAFAAKMATAGKTELKCDWDDAAFIQREYIGLEKNIIGEAEKNEYAKIVGCSEVIGTSYYMMIIQYWYPTEADIQACKVVSNWRIYTSCRQLIFDEEKKVMTWAECLQYTGD